MPWAPTTRLAPTLPSRLANTRLPRGEGACQVPGEDGGGLAHVPAQYEQGGGRARTPSSLVPFWESPKTLTKVELGIQAWHLPLGGSVGAWG